MNILQFIQAIQVLINSPSTGLGTGILGPLQPLFISFMGNTPLDLTTTNQVVVSAWGTMLAIADAFFLLLILIGTIQIMISNNTGSLTLPLNQFVPKIIITALLMNLSFFFGENLLFFNNLLCGVINVNLDAFFNTVNNGARITQTQSLVLYYAVIILLNITLIRLLFQAFERLVFWNLLFVLGPLRILILVSATNILRFFVLGTYVYHCHLYSICTISGLCSGSFSAGKCRANRICQLTAGSCHVASGRKSPRFARTLPIHVGSGISGHWPCD